ncbi:MAG TPA: response regulator [Geobacteraceae bacterium]
MPSKILLVDDVGMFLEIQKGFLKRSSAKILTARDGVEALEVVKKEHPALIFMDLYMPRMNGAECCALLKADPFFKGIPVILTSAVGKEEDRALCLQAGCDAFLTKPLERVPYLAAARRFLPTIDRRNLRIPCRAKVKFRVFGVPLSGDTYDVGDNGIYLATNYEVQVGTELEVIFSLPDAAGTLIKATGRVAWLNMGGERRKPSFPEGFGVEFLQLEEEMHAALQRFVASSS